jgi:hypothetical protein
MDNPFRDGGPLDRAVPWLSAVIAVLLAAGTADSGAAPVVKVLALSAATAVVARSAYLVIRRRRTAR